MGPSLFSRVSVLVAGVPNEGPKTFQNVQRHSWSPGGRRQDPPLMSALKQSGAHHVPQGTPCSGGMESL